MKLTEILKQDSLSLSFEVFPPKTDMAFDSVKHATEEIAKLSPSFMSVTYGAGGGTSKYTLEIAKNIKERYGVPTLAHLTCVSSTKQTVAEKSGASYYVLSAASTDALLCEYFGKSEGQSFDESLAFRHPSYEGFISIYESAREPLIVSAKELQ